jgi:hypothetical protein
VIGKTQKLVKAKLHRLLTMGRRAKNKQAAPIPFSEPRESDNRPSPKKLGKRKAVEEDPRSSRPAKKVKEIESRVTGKVKPKSTGKVKFTAEGGKNERKAKDSKRKTAASDEGSEGWEDVEEEVDLKAQAK